MKIKNSTKILLVLGAGVLVTTTACNNGPKSDPNKHTYNTYLSTKPKTWNVHTWQTSDESYIQGFCSMGFYDLQLNSTKDGYEFVNEMASAEPQDVSSEVDAEDLEKYGYKGNVGAGYVWDIPLNRAAVWEDGSEIKAADYVQSMKYQLDPKMQNYRADGYYSSSMVIANAERYFKQGNESIEEANKFLDKKTGEWTAENVGDDGNFYLNVEKPTTFVASCFSNVDTAEPFWTVLRQPGAGDTEDLKLAAERIKDAVIYYCWKYVSHEGEHEKDWEEIEGYGKLSSVKEEWLNYDIEIGEFSDKKVLVRKDLSENNEETAVTYSTAMLKSDLSKVVAHYARVSDSKFNWKLPLFVTVYNAYTQQWGDEDDATSGVGLTAVDPYKIRLYLSKPMTALDLKFSLTGTWLVKNDLYASLIETNPTNGTKTTRYASPAEGVKGYMSYGPYKLTTFDKGKEFRMTKNDKWYGWNDGKHVGQFAIDEIYTRTIEDHKSALLEFMAGRIDDIDLTREDMKTYGQSRRLTRTFESYTQKISFNSDRASLLKRQTKASANKVVLANKDFREGLSLALDRNGFAAQATAGSKGFTGLLNDLYLTDVEDGEMYRNTPQGKAVYDMVYNKLGGNPYAADYVEGPLSKEANGYNMDMATWFVAKGLKAELTSTDEGHMVAGSDTKVSIDFRVYDNKAEATLEMKNFIQKKWDEVMSKAVAKLKEDGTLGANDNIVLDIALTKDEDYYTTATRGEYDMIFSTWGGAAINPQGLMEVYCKAEFTQTCEYGFKGKQGSVLIAIDADGDGTIGDTETKSFDTWYSELIGITETDEKNTTEWNRKHQRILNILSGLEAGILNRFEAVPLVARASSSLNSWKIENGTENYINLIGYGGIRHIKFNMNDGEWAKYCKAHNYKLDSEYIS